MSSILAAASAATRPDLVKGLERAAAAGQTSTAETVLSALAARAPREADAAAARGLRRAVHSRRWETAAYFADFLADGEKRRAAGGAAGGAAGDAARVEPPRAETEREVLRCLGGAVAPTAPRAKSDGAVERVFETCVVSHRAPGGN